MRKKSLVIPILILVVIIAGFVYLLTSSDASEEEAKMQEVQATTTSAVSNPQAPVSKSQPGVYIAYSEQAVASAQGTKLLFFHAPWCPQCRQIDKDITTNGVPDDVTVFKVDYDTNQALRKKYGVTLQTTVVRIDDEGKLVKKIVAYDEPTFQAVKDALL